MMIGLTGGYCAGKNTAASLLEDRGWTCIDVDLLGHEALEDCAEAIVRRFGAASMGGDGRIDRGILGLAVFSDPEALADLEAIVHPRMFALVDRRIREISDESARFGREALICINAAILYKMPQLMSCSGVIEVRADMATRIRRGGRRDGLPASEIKKRIRGQRALWRLRSRVGDRVVFLDNSDDGALLGERLSDCLRTIESRRAEKAINS